MWARAAWAASIGFISTFVGFNGPTAGSELGLTVYAPKFEKVPIVEGVSIVNLPPKKETLVSRSNVGDLLRGDGFRKSQFDLSTGTDHGFTRFNSDVVERDAILGQQLHLCPCSGVISGCLPVVLEFRKNPKLCVVFAEFECASLNENIGPQLSLGGSIGAFDQFFGRSPEQPSRYTEYNSKEGDDSFTVLVKPLTSTSSSDFVENQETADVFVKGTAACMILMLMYAGLKRW